MHSTSLYGTSTQIATAETAPAHTIPARRFALGEARLHHSLTAGRSSSLESKPTRIGIAQFQTLSTLRTGSGTVALFSPLTGLDSGDACDSMFARCEQLRRKDQRTAPLLARAARAARSSYRRAPATNESPRV
jgi:DUF1009 family protein